MPYEEYVRARVLQPVGATRTRQGRTRMGDALPDEVKYYLPGANASMGPSVFPGEGAVPTAYGGFYLEAMDSHGGWVSSTVDLLRFLTGVDGRANRPDILSAALVTEMTSNGATVCADGSCHYAGGWYVRPAQGDETWWHTGMLVGNTSVLVRSSQNVSWVALFNAWPTPGSLGNELDAALWNALGQAASFPTHDLFSTFR